LRSRGRNLRRLVFAFAALGCFALPARAGDADDLEATRVAPFAATPWRVVDEMLKMARVGPGNRLPNGMNPTLFLRDGKAVLGCSAVGGGLHYKTLQSLSCVLDFGMDPQSSVDTPAFLPNGVEDGTFDPKVLDGVKALGKKVHVLSRKELQPGYWVGVQVNPTNNHLLGGVSRGLEGGVVGY